jgi:hypothetical protein
VVAPPAGTTQEERPTYLKGFDGIASEPFPDEVRKILAEPVVETDVEIKPDGIVFLPGVAWRRILTRAFGAGGWAIAPRGPSRVMGNIVIYHGALYALGRFVGEAVGECFYRENNANMSYASCVEGARTDCIGRIAKDLGYGAEMWDGNWREQWKAKYATSYQDREGKTRWKLKQRVSNPHDLMAGAGGVAPPAETKSPSPSSPPPAEREPSSTSGVAPVGVGIASPGSAAPSAASAAPASSPSAEPPTESPTAPAAAPSGSSDLASDQAKADVRGVIKALTWTKAFIRLTFRQWFGDAVGTAPNPIEALTQAQAEAGYLLLKMYGGDGYDALVAELRAQGRIR